jgi:protease I
MQKPLLGQKVAFLVANGFFEADLVEAQKSIQTLGADTRIISMDQGLVSSLNEQGWGLNFASDQPLNESLAADYSAVVVPGGRRSIEKLQLTAHTRRFLRGFYETGKPVCVIGEGVQLLGFAEIDAEAGAENLLVLETVSEQVAEFVNSLLLEEQAVAA